MIRTIYDMPASNGEVLLSLRGGAARGGWVPCCKLGRLRSTHGTYECTSHSLNTGCSASLPEETRKDSLSMKTVLEPLTITIINYLFLFQIAVVTMFFLPGATIAVCLFKR